ncbi:unnamed protein product [[Candida] boidinii]|uniref:Unnamed protein product n=1 Tax=Candida boidinii TaxID=5477 RepID=A0ACB5TPI2_CANBO|nr:unnamed protein product [[Candida] boidinii]
MVKLLHSAEKDTTTETTTHCPKCEEEGGDSGDSTVTEGETLTETVSCSTTEGSEATETGSGEGSEESGASDEYTVVSITPTSSSTTTVCDEECQKSQSGANSPEEDLSTYEGSAPHMTIGISAFVIGLITFFF